MLKTYSELIQIPSFQERIEYLSLNGKVGSETFGEHRYLNQLLYSSYDWKQTRREVITRDLGLDLGHEDYPIMGDIYVHHINPITIDDITNSRPCVFDLTNLISTSFNTHNMIHYGNDKLPKMFYIERKKNDTCPWRR